MKSVPIKYTVKEGKELKKYKHTLTLTDEQYDKLSCSFVEKILKEQIEQRGKGKLYDYTMYFGKGA